ncbi:ankyrin repeat-containing protein [Aspergillus flavus AF70]|nr:ankyrin repeat-containing protein [Aspergillus flavus AF70]
MHRQMSALLWAADHGMVETAQYSLNASFGVSDNEKLEIFYDALSAAVQAGHTTIAKVLLLQEGIDPNFQYQSKEDNSWVTFLARAAQAGHVDMVALLLSTKGINPNLGDDMGRPPIAHAGFSNQDPVVEQLLATPGVDINWKDHHGRTPLSWTVSYGSKAAVSQFLSRQDIDVNAAMATDYMWKEGWTALMFAANRGFTEKVELLLNAPYINVNHQCARGKTALHLAAKTGSEVTVQLLLAKEAYPDLQDRYGGTPLYEAALFGYLPIMNLLYQAGADPDIVIDGGDTAITVASSRGYTDIVAFLLETGKINLASQGSEDKRNALSWAAERGHGEVVGLLLQYGQEANAQDCKGRTPLSYAIQYGHVEIIKMLLLNSSSIDPMEVDADGETLHSRAIKHDNPEIMNLLASIKGAHQ